MRHASAQNADLSDVLMDRAVLNDSNLTNANLSRAILTRRVCLPCYIQSLLGMSRLLQRCQVFIVWRLPRFILMRYHSDACPALQE